VQRPTERPRKSRSETSEALRTPSEGQPPVLEESALPWAEMDEEDGKDRSKREDTIEDLRSRSHPEPTGSGAVPHRPLGVCQR
jgi:hypothetical protein